MKLTLDDDNNIIIDWGAEVDEDKLIASIKRYIDAWIIKWSYNNSEKTISLHKGNLMNWYTADKETLHLLWKLERQKIYKKQEKLVGVLCKRLPSG